MITTMIKIDVIKRIHKIEMTKKFKLGSYFNKETDFFSSILQNFNNKLVTRSTYESLQVALIYWLTGSVHDMK